MTTQASTLIMPSRPFLGAALLCATLALQPAMAKAADAAKPHQEAMAALHDLDAAVAEIDRASGLSASSPDPYRRAAHRAINALGGAQDATYDAASGNPGDAAGALGHLNALEGAGGSAAWLPAVRTALVNATVAQNRLSSALDSDGLDEFQAAATSAMESLLVAIGRGSETGPLGGLYGALSTTAMGVPDGADVADGCAAPSKAPVYGVAGGRLLYVAVAPGGGADRFSVPLAIAVVRSHAGVTVLETAAAAMSHDLCKDGGWEKADATDASAGAGASTQTASADPAPSTANRGATTSSSNNAAGTPPASDRASAQTADNASSATDASSPSGSGSASDGGLSSGSGGNLPKLYTEAQAVQGAGVFAMQCASCHGGQLQGKSAPAIGGQQFLNKAKILGWSAADLRHIVVTSMPRSNPGSLSKQQYAEVLAYLLAVNCYPAGDKPFPQATDSQLQNAKLHPVAGMTLSKNPALCTVKGGG
ncbi:c-type cytochrome [Jiella sp. M17.18]|uniref:c-type cytochrome n=1 Tax=Jiella sp. M17.18 TaxID=3234247 RepID=UPI0034DF92E2